MIKFLWVLVLIGVIGLGVFLTYAAAYVSAWLGYLIGGLFSLPDWAIYAIWYGIPVSIAIMDLYVAYRVFLRLIH